MEYITKETAIKAIKGICLNGDIPQMIWSTDAMDAVRNAPDGWISVKDRLPEKNGDYLIYNTDGIVWPYWYDKEYKEWYDSSGYLTESVTHWMPMPEPPKEEEQNA